MNKDQTLEAINKAKLAHEAQMIKIEAVIEGEDVKNPTAVNQTKCAFGKWLYDDNNEVEKILGAQFYNNIDILHSKWHMEYIRIFETFFKEKKSGFFSKMLGTKKIDGMELDKAKLYHSELLNTTSELLKVLAASERRISAMCDNKFT